MVLSPPAIFWAVATLRDSCLDSCSDSILCSTTIAGIEVIGEMGLALSVGLLVHEGCVAYKYPSTSGCTAMTLAVALPTHALEHYGQTYPEELRRWLGLSK
jgi:hypothetical protein